MVLVVFTQSFLCSSVLASDAVTSSDLSGHALARVLYRFVQPGQQYGLEDLQEALDVRFVNPQYDSVNSSHHSVAGQATLLRPAIPGYVGLSESVRDGQRGTGLQLNELGCSNPRPILARFHQYQYGPPVELDRFSDGPDIRYYQSKPPGRWSLSLEVDATQKCTNGLVFYYITPVLP